MGSRALLRRLLLIPPTLFGVVVVTFVLLRVIPGDPIAMMIPPGAQQADVARLRHLYGLDRGIPAQFGRFLADLGQGRFGRSIGYRQDVVGLILRHLPATLELVLLAAILAIGLGLALALVGVAMRSRAPEWLIDTTVAAGLAIPDFLWGLALVLAFAVAWPVLPVTGRIDPRLESGFVTHFYLLESFVTLRFGILANLLAHMTLPAIALALPLAASIARVLKVGLAEAEQQDYAQMARARGFSRARVLIREALPNAAIPAVSLSGVQLTFLLGGTVLIERLFAYEGVGNMAIEAVINRDLPLIQGLILTFGLLFIIINLGVDMLILALDPRIRDG